MDKVKEAVKRMKMLNIMPSVIDEFEKDGVIEVSERMCKEFPAVLYWATNDTYSNESVQLMDEVRKFEKEYSALVYHIQLLHTEYGDLYSFFYVSDWPINWEEERAVLSHKKVYCYVFNANAPENSEFGMIGIKPAMGGVERTW